VKAFQDELCESVRKNHYYDSPFGVRRWISKSWGKDLEREVKNIPEQLNAALIMNESQVLLHRRRAPIILQRHDEFLLEIPEADLDMWVETLREVMERPIPQLGGAIFPIDIQVGKNYGAYHKDTNPYGMRDISETSRRGR
jgi:DNA polymerase I-like protein with 3'-5' exonuclease and polymerase domains